MRWVPLLLCAALQAQTVVKYWPGEHPRAEFAEWAMKDWARVSAGAFKVEKVASAEEADIYFAWLTGEANGLYGQAQKFRLNGKPISRVTINASSDQFEGPTGKLAAQDPLFAEVMLYMTCVHEAGHALGMEHTRDFADIMYSFQYGGDFAEYFQRYRKKLKVRGDMAKTSVIAPNDIIQLRKLWPAQTQTQKRSGAVAPTPPK